MGFVELFYPKELKELIVFYKAKDDLNGYALAQIDKHFLMQIGVGFIFVAVFFWSTKNLELSLIVSPLILLGPISDLQRLVKNGIVPYTEGRVQRVVIKHIEYMDFKLGHPGSWYLSYDLKDGLDTKTQFNSKVVPKHAIPKSWVNGKEIYVCFHPEIANYNKPLLRCFVGTLCLSEDRAKKLTEISKGD